MVFFDFDADDIRRDAKKVLGQAVELLKKYPLLKLKIDSDTDSRGSTNYNERLSKTDPWECSFT